VDGAEWGSVVTDAKAELKGPLCYGSRRSRRVSFITLLLECLLNLDEGCTVYFL